MSGKETSKESSFVTCKVVRFCRIPAGPRCEGCLQLVGDGAEEGGTGPKWKCSLFGKELRGGAECQRCKECFEWVWLTEEGEDVAAVIRE